MASVLGDPAIGTASTLARSADASNRYRCLLSLKSYRNAMRSIPEAGNDEQLVLESFYRSIQFQAQQLAKNIQEGFSLGLLRDMAGEHEEALTELSLLLVELDIQSTRSVPDVKLEDFTSSATTCPLARLANQCTKYRTPLFDDQGREFIADVVEGMRKIDCQIR